VFEAALYQSFHGRLALRRFFRGQETQRLDCLATLLGQDLEVNALARILPEDT
jgi:hypothetical protein